PAVDVPRVPDCAGMPGSRRYRSSKEEGARRIGYRLRRSALPNPISARVPFSRTELAPAIVAPTIDVASLGERAGMIAARGDLCHRRRGRKGHAPRDGAAGKRCGIRNGAVLGIVFSRNQTIHSQLAMLVCAPAVDRAIAAQETGMVLSGRD